MSVIVGFILKWPATLVRQQGEESKGPWSYCYGYNNEVDLEC